MNAHLHLGDPITKRLPANVAGGHSAFLCAAADRAHGIAEITQGAQEHKPVIPYEFIKAIIMPKT